MERLGLSFLVLLYDLRAARSRNTLILHYYILKRYIVDVVFMFCKLRGDKGTNNGANRSENVSFHKEINFYNVDGNKIDFFESRPMRGAVVDKDIVDIEKYNGVIGELEEGQSFVEEETLSKKS